MSRQITYNRPVPQSALPFARILFVCAIVVLTYNSIKPAANIGSIANFDKVLHVIAYFVFTGVTALAFPKLRLALLALWPALYGGLMEIAQGSMSTGRTGSIYDMLANIVGVIAAITMWCAVVILVKRFGKQP